MSTVTDTVTALRERSVDWASGALAGLVAGVFGGALVWWSQTSVIATAIPAAFGITPPAPLVGLLLFVGQSVLLGLAYAAVFDRGRLRAGRATPSARSYRAPPTVSPSGWSSLRASSPS